MSHESCNCIADFDAQLIEHRLDTSMALASNNIVLRTYTPLIRKDTDRRESRSTRPRIAKHNFCPFCGKSYDATPETATVTEATDAQP